LNADSDARILMSMMSDDLKNVIRTAGRDSLTVRGLNELLEERVIDKNDDGPLPFRACPKCGSDQLQHFDHLDAESDEMYYVIRCTDCSWGDWTQ